VCVIVAAIVAAVTRSSLPARAGEISAFQAAIHEPVQHWGRIEIYGMRPAIADLAGGTGDAPPAAIGAEARAWQNGFAQIGQQLDAATVPGYLSHAMALFKQALADYVHAARFVEQGAAINGEARTGLLDQAAAAAQSGDCAYDDASVAIQQARHDAGLGTTIDFPDHPCAGSRTTP
jgi:hypothetical protein